MGDVGELDLPVPAELPADRLHHRHRQRPRPFHIGLNVYVFTGLMFLLGICWAFGKASVFKYISDDYPQNIGTISGIVGLAGGMGGFVLPIMFGALMDLTGIRSSAFMLMYGVVWVSLIWMYFTEVRRADCHGCARCRASRQPLISFKGNAHHVCHHPQRAPGASAHPLGTGGQVLLGARGRSHRQAQPLDLGACACSWPSPSGKSGAWSP